jgi:hypothetical protein
MRRRLTVTGASSNIDGDQSRASQPEPEKKQKRKGKVCFQIPVVNHIFFCKSTSFLMFDFRKIIAKSGSSMRHYRIFWCFKEGSRTLQP